MSLTGMYRARIHNVRLLVGFVLTKLRRRQRHAIIGISGCGLTGKKTLASRFNAMNQGPFQEAIPPRYYYTACIDLDTRRTNGTGDLYLKIYIIPPPSDLPEENPRGFILDIHNFSAMIFICSIIRIVTFLNLLPNIQELRNVWNGMPHFLLVGNKIDFDRIPNARQFTFDYASSLTHSYFGVNYKECSAGENINVDSVLEEILQTIVAEQP